MQNNFTKNIAIMRKNIHRGMTETQANQIIDSMEAQLKGAMQWTTESRAYIGAMRTEVTKGFGGTISAADAMRQLGVEVVRIS